MPDPASTRPAVTVSGAAAAGSAPDLLEGGRERPRLDAAARRRLLLAGAVVGALGLGALGVERVVASRAAAAEEARAAQVVALTAGSVRSSSVQIGGDVGALRFRLTVRVALRNDGPRPLEVTAAALGPYVAPGAPLVEPGQVQDVVLERLVVCPQAPAIPEAEPLPAALDLELETAAGARTTTLALAPDVLAPLAEAVRRACGVLTLSDALLVVPVSSQRRGLSVLVDLEVANATSREVRLVQVAVQQGLRGDVRGPAGAPLPLVLPARQPGEPEIRLPLQVELSLASCRSLFELTPAPPGALPLDTLLVTLEDETGRSRPLPADLDLPELYGLVSDVC